MTKITATIATLTSISIFLSFSPSAFAAQDFDYYFGTLLAPSNKIVNPVSPIPVSSASDIGKKSPTSAQISAMQTNLNQIKSTLANLNSSLAKSNSNPELAVAKGIPLLLIEETKKKENTQSIFASLIPPDVKNFPLLSTYLVILTLALFGVIIYLYFVRKQTKSQSV